MEKPRKFMLYSIGLLFLSQFFKYDSDWAISPSFDYSTNRFTSTGYYYQAETGWGYHGWVGGLIIGLLAFFFYFRNPRLRSYWIALPFIMILAFGGSTGGAMGFISMLIAGYAIYLKRKEQKLSVTTIKEK